MNVEIWAKFWGHSSVTYWIQVQNAIIEPGKNHVKSMIRINKWKNGNREEILGFFVCFVTILARLLIRTHTCIT